MWEAIFNVIKSFFAKDTIRESLRADFSAIAENWEKFAMRLQEDLNRAKEEIIVLRDKIHEIYQAELLCEEERSKDRIKLAELERKIDILMDDRNL